MKLSLGILATAVALATFACGGIALNLEAAPDAGDLDAQVPDGEAPLEDAGAWYDAAVRPDAATDAGGAFGTRIAEGNVVLYGVTTSDDVVYGRRSNVNGPISLEIYSLERRQVTVIDPSLPPATWVSVAGNALAYWETVDVTTGIGSLSYWSAWGGLRRDITNRSLRGYFWASSGGQVVAFYDDVRTAQGVPVSAELVVAQTRLDAMTRVLAGSNRVAIDPSSCIPTIGFADRRLVATYCRPGETAARLVTVDDESPPVANVLVSDELRSFWSADKLGARILVFDRYDQASIVETSRLKPAPRFQLEPGVVEGVVLKNGIVVYRTDAALRRVSIGGGVVYPPVTVAHGDARGILGLTPDEKTILFHALPGRPVDPGAPEGERFSDLRTVSTNAIEAAPRVLVDTERALPYGVTSDGAHALYFGAGSRLHAVPLDGSAEKTIAPQFNAVEVTPFGSGVVVAKNVRDFGGTTVGDLAHVDLTGTGAPLETPVAESVPSGGFRFGVRRKTTLIFVRRATTGSGLYHVELL